MRNRILIVFFCIGMFLPVFGQDAMQSVDKIMQKYNTVKDYKVQVKVVADVPMVKILPSKATIYFKQKNKFKISSKGIVLLPKQGFSEMYDFLATPSKYIAVYGVYEMVDKVRAHVVNIIPNGVANEMVLAKLWVDESNDVIVKSQITTKTNGTILTTYEYEDQLKFGLPSKMTFEIEVKKFKMPKSVASDINKVKKTKEVKKKKGIIVLSLSDYSVNKGIDNSFFEK